jgi:hypothetical protein
MAIKASAKAENLLLKAKSNLNSLEPSINALISGHEEV